MELTKSSLTYGREGEAAEALSVNIDGGHIKARGDSRSFEVMIATVYRPENLIYIDRNHNAIESKTVVASAKDDQQESIKMLFKRVVSPIFPGSNLIYLIPKLVGVEASSC